MKISQILIDGRKEKRIYDHNPRISWTLSGDEENIYQKCYRIRLAKAGDPESCIYDSGEVNSDACAGVEFSVDLEPFTEYELFLAVTSTSEAKAEAATCFTTGKGAPPTEAVWITGDTGEQVTYSAKKKVYREKGTLLFRKEVNLEKRPVKAYALCSALGCYDLYLNGELVSSRYFAPGYTQYTSRVQYQTIDITDKIRTIEVGKAEFMAEVSAGWYAGRLGLVLDGSRFGERPAFLAEILLFYQDGSREMICTDDSWQAAKSPCRKMAGFFDGEIYDAGSSPEEAVWKKAKILDHARRLCITENKKGPKPASETMLRQDGLPELVEDLGEEVRCHEQITPVLVSRTGNELIFDVGRNLAGVVALKDVAGHGGDRIMIETGEVLDQGRVYRGNLRTAGSRIEYICREDIHSYEPRFTYMGFRYISVKLTGLVKSCDGSDFSERNLLVRELYSDMDIIGSFECSNPDINQLQRNILTSQKANFMDIPTDCPQRDERCGWTGDITTFSSTALYNMDCSRFLSRWLRDVNILQKENGMGFAPFVVPDNGMGRKEGGGTWGSSEHKGVDAVWGDAAVILPWNMYLSTGDIRILQDSFAGMKSQVDYVSGLIHKDEKDKSYIFKAGFQLGDWLAPGENMIKNIMKAKWTSTAYYANSAHIVAMAAEALGDPENAARYQALYERICLAFRNTFLKKGHIKKGFQSIYALGICFGILTEEEVRLAAEDLAENVRKHENHLSTGFVGTPYLPFALSDTGHMDVAYDLLLQDTFPSWLYPVKAGATSIWERWDSLKPDGSINGAGDMVSFNHYSYGAVGDFLYRRVAGLEMLSPGYRTFRIAPNPGGNLTWVRTCHRTLFGEIAVSWQRKGKDLQLTFTVPAGTTAYLEDTDSVSWADSRREYGSGTYQISGRIR